MLVAVKNIGNSAQIYPFGHGHLFFFSQPLLARGAAWP
jgi:hypothetical protein